MGLHEDLIAATQVPAQLVGSAASLVLGKLPWQGSCRGRGGCPGKGLAGGVRLALLLFVSLVLALFFLSGAFLCPT